MNHLNALLDAGYITAERRNRKNGARTSNRYFLQLETVPNVEPENVRTAAEPMSGFSENLCPDLEDRMSGIRTAYKDEPKEEPKGEPSDKPLEGIDVIVKVDLAGRFFEEFWKVYPRHEARKLAEAKFRKILTSKTPPNVIIDGARRYADYVRAVGRTPETIAHPTTWLNQERWTDELAAPPTAATASKPTVMQNAAAAHDELLRRQQAHDRREISA